MKTRDEHLKALTTIGRNAPSESERRRVMKKAIRVRRLDRKISVLAEYNKVK